MLAKQTVQGMRYRPEGSLWHFSAKSKDNKREFQEDRRKWSTGGWAKGVQEIFKTEEV